MFETLAYHAYEIRIICSLDGVELMAKCVCFAFWSCLFCAFFILKVMEEQKSGGVFEILLLVVVWVNAFQICKVL